jgi:hypothetical protein
MSSNILPWGRWWLINISMTNTPQPENSQDDDELVVVKKVGGFAPQPSGNNPWMPRKPRFADQDSDTNSESSDN